MPPNTNLTSTQQEALDVYRRLTAKKGEPPTISELADALGKSRNAAFVLTRYLREKGYLSMKPVTIIRPTLTAKGRKAQ